MKDTDTSDATTQDPLEALADAMLAQASAFAAQNSFSLFCSSGETYVKEAELLKKLKPLLSAEELETVTTFVKSRKKALAIVNGLLQAHFADSKALGKTVLDTYATPLGKGWYEFYDRSTCRTVRAQVVGFDACYRTREGTICGSVRVSPHGNGSSEPWSFHIKDGRMVVLTEDLY